MFYVQRGTMFIKLSVVLINRKIIKIISGGIVVDYKELLTETNRILDKYKLLYETTGRYFNFLDILDLRRDELAISRLLVELLSPKGSHHQGSRYLRVFMEEILNIKKLTKDELDTAIVYREYFYNNRRIDIVIKTKDRTIPIEVKIDASDLANQLYDYYDIARNSNIYYLTLYGDPPSEDSAKGLTCNRDSESGYNEISLISFKNDIINWLELCIKDSKTIEMAPIREILLQFKRTLEAITSKGGADVEEEVLSLILKSENSIKSAKLISELFLKAKKELLKDIFIQTENKVKYNKVSPEDFSNSDFSDTIDYKYNNYSKINTYYNIKGSTWPGITYPYKKNLEKDYDIWVRFELGKEYFYVGYIITKNGEKYVHNFSQDKIKKLIGRDGKNPIDWWLDWEYISIDGSNNYPSMKNIDDEALKLFDDKLDIFTSECAKKISKYIECKNNL